MNNTLLKLQIKAKNLLSSEEGQDMVEYALVIALIVLGATATLNYIGGTIGGFLTALGTAFGNWAGI